MEKFRLDPHADLTVDSVSARPGNVLVAVRNPHHLQHLGRILDKTDTRKIDIVVISVHMVTQAASGEHALDTSQLFPKMKPPCSRGWSRWRKRRASTSN